ncbi:MAG: prepilin peptidase [Rhodomicrobium sp.]|jgi:prepilin peptidase CpaA
MDSPLTAMTAAALPVLMVWAAAVDIFTRAIPNRVVLALAAGFALFTAAAQMPLSQISLHLLCAAAVLALGFLLYSRSLFGGGDAKLLSVAALWFGFNSLLPFLAATALAGGALSLFTLAAGTAGAQFGLIAAPSRTIPYGAAIATGALAVFPDWLLAF